MNKWSALTGKYSDDRSAAFSGLQYNYVFLVESQGTQKGSRFSSSLKLKKLFSVLFAVISEKSSGSLTKSGAEPYRNCLQFPNRSESSLRIVMSEIGCLVPYYINDHVLLRDDIVKVKKWFETVTSLDLDTANRIEKCAHFINHAMNSSDIESYINYFVALDAIFGERGSVEASVSSGVATLDDHQEWAQKISWLFDLRNELVHGGSRYIKEWSRYYNYYRHFDSEPDEDIEKIAFAALYRAPAILLRTQAGNISPN